MKKSKIEWCDHTFNPWEGCAEVSPACAHCYAAARNARFHRGRAVNWGKGAPRRRTSAKNWSQPIFWNRIADSFRECLRCGRRDQMADVCYQCGGGETIATRPRVFCASLADWLDDEVPVEWLADLLVLIYATPHLDWLLLTKRPQNFERRVHAAAKVAWDGAESLWVAGDAPENVWVGTTVEDQLRADQRIPELLRIPAKVRFLSCEPLLGPIHFDKVPGFNKCGSAGREIVRNLWVITGGESGPQARPSNPQWFRDLRDQCATADVPFLFKQWGEWVSVSEVEGEGTHYKFPDGRTVRRVGKKLAGRRLGGVEHNAFPTLS